MTSTGHTPNTIVVAGANVEVDVTVIGRGQAGLAVGFYLRRAGLVPGRGFVVLDAEEGPGGAWQHMWDGLRLFPPLPTPPSRLDDAALG